MGRIGDIRASAEVKKHRIGTGLTLPQCSENLLGDRHHRDADTIRRSMLNISFRV
jgi:hypothetical protein